MNKILIVDDDERIIDMIAEYMKLYQIETVQAVNGYQALERLNPSIQLVLLDINMKDFDGLEVCREIRKKSKVPIIFVTANASQFDKVKGLGAGADDYITKPFDPMELVARVQAQIRRYQEYAQSPSLASGSRIVRFDNITVDRMAHRVTKGGETLHLSATEFKLLLYFIDHADKALDRKQILSDVWESETYDLSTVTTYVKRLREKLQGTDLTADYIKSVRGVGYIFIGKLDS